LNPYEQYPPNPKQHETFLVMEGSILTNEIPRY